MSGMSASVVPLSVPAEPSFARSVRMMAANLAVLCSMSVDEVEDTRMAAEEAFVYACATAPATCEITFEVRADQLGMSFSLGGVDPLEESELVEQVGLAELLLSAVCDSYEFADDGSVLQVTKLVGSAHAA